MAGSLFDLAGRRALITGSSQGIGLALARGLAAGRRDGGAQRPRSGRSSPPRPRRSPGAARLAFDVTDHAAVAQAVDAAEAADGPIDILVNNAGSSTAPRSRTSRPRRSRGCWRRTSPASSTSPGVRPAHAPARAGKIVNIASVNAALARATIAPYTATKGAVANLTKGMAADWARHGLNCNAIAPGYMRTPLNEALWSDPAFNEWLERRTPAGRWGASEELVGACVFLASDAASFVNGHVLYVDGGLTASL